ncbi:proline oxidase PrnD [Myriangium duriaei CBS 260.36]|uniref:Proline dehydrogenase n=1 Tax=Myriangium duriaei CBS 260.36 TaxID=1168546 RepID=A0A9P4MNN8_9PEZI|nr:proline oxidase PrnD [Myriangium duriaei CBS 260.36]
MPPRAPRCITTTTRRLPAFSHPSISILRQLHTSRPQGNATLSTTTQDQAPTPLIPKVLLPKPAPAHTTLSCLPLSVVLRTYLITALSSSPLLLSTVSKILLRFLSSKSWLTSVERNPILNLALRETFYKQFCAGETKSAVRSTMAVQESIGYHGVMLEYALEVLSDSSSSNESVDVATWRRGLLDSVDAARPGDFVGLKWSGLGSAAFQLLKAGADPSPLMHNAIHEVCAAAYAKGVRLLPASEETTTNPAIDAWSLALQRKYNRGPAGCIVYNTYQAYLVDTPAVLARHIAIAQEEGFVFGAKLVRGAYLDHEPRHVIWATKEETDAAYDSLAAALVRKEYAGQLQPTGENTAWPEVQVVLATHNAASARKVVAIRREQTARGEKLVPLVYAQLQGMADEVSCDLLAAGREVEGEGYVPQVFKMSAWGTLSQCLNYLLRRAAENKDAAGRTYESRDAMGAELRRRASGFVGL